MPKFAANLTMMFTEWGFLDRFQAAADAGFEAVEYLFPYDFSADAIAERLRQNNLSQALFNLPAGDWAAGDRGLAALPDRADEFQETVTKSLDYATIIGVKRLHMMAGIAGIDALETYKTSTKYAAEQCLEQGLNLLLEPINNRSVPGYFLNDFKMAAQVIETLDLPNLKLQFDIFHRQIIHGDVIIGLQELLPIIDHIQVASIPSRHEPDGGELNYPFVFSELDRLGFQGYVGCEYNPRGKTLDGLQWFEPYRR